MIDAPNPSADYALSLDPSLSPFRFVFALYILAVAYLDQFAPPGYLSTPSRIDLSELISLKMAIAISNRKSLDSSPFFSLESKVKDACEV